MNPVEQRVIESAAQHNLDIPPSSDSQIIDFHWLTESLFTPKWLLIIKENREWGRERENGAKSFVCRTHFFYLYSCSRYFNRMCSFFDTTSISGMKNQMNDGKSFAFFAPLFNFAGWLVLLPPLLLFLMTIVSAMTIESRGGEVCCQMRFRSAFHLRFSFNLGFTETSASLRAPSSPPFSSVSGGEQLKRQIGAGMSSS